MTSNEYEQRIKELNLQITALMRRALDSEALQAREASERMRLEADINAIRHSTSWRLTQPLRISIELIRSVKSSNHARFQLLQKAALHGDQDARRVILAAVQRRINRFRRFGLTGSTPDAPEVVVSERKFNEHETVVSSYEVWSSRLDTPSFEALNALNRSADVSLSVKIVICLSSKASDIAERTLTALHLLVGVRWSAFVVVAQNANESDVRRLKGVFGEDHRVQFDAPSIHAGDILLLIEEGAVPRAFGPRIMLDALSAKPAGSSLLVYSDEDQQSTDGSLSDPWFKPTFSPLLAQQQVLLGRMVGVRPDALLAEKLNQCFVSKQSAYVNALGLCVAQIPRADIQHIPHVLFHNVIAPSVPLPLVAPALPEVLPIASILIPTRDGWHLLGPCLASLRKTDWPMEKFEVIVVDNGSTEAETLEGLLVAEEAGHIRVIRDPSPFNFAALNNKAAAASRGALLVLLNNDTEIIDPAWLKKLAAFALLPDVGAVGPKLLFEDSTVQHGGVILGIQGVAAHAHLFLEKNEGGYRGLANLTHEVSAVTGACLAVSRAAFEEVGGLREEFRVAFNDVVFCLDLLKTGRRNIYVAEPLLFHYESKTRGYDDRPEKLQLLRKESRIAWSRHAALLRADPYYSPNLSMESPYKLAFASRRRAAWSDKPARPGRIMMLSSTHAIGHGVAVVIDLQVRALLAKGYEVVIAGSLSANDYPYVGCEKVEVYDPRAAAAIASEKAIDVVVAHTPPFFAAGLWAGNSPFVIAYDYGEPPADFFPDAHARGEVNDNKTQSLVMCHQVFAISEAVARESITPPDGIIPLGNGHLGRWSDARTSQREATRRKYQWDAEFVILNVCRFTSGERLYKGVDEFCKIKMAFEKTYPDLVGRVVFVLCGKGSPDDIAEMRALGLVVAPNVTDQEMADLYTAADGYANFSKWEGYNLGIGQALAMGLRVIASDIPAHRAFGVPVTNVTEEAVGLLHHMTTTPVQREARVWEWEEPLEQFTQLVDTAYSVVRKPWSLTVSTE